MEVILFIAICFVMLTLLVPKPPEASSKCPPHKWKNVEIKDEAGETIMWKLVCERCGPPQYTARKNETN
jgi:hypothetical protein